MSIGMTPYATLAAARMLAMDGRCKTLDASADGYGRGECCGVIHVGDSNKVGAAAHDMSRSTALLIGSGVNQDGRSSSLTAPNGPSQQALIVRTMQVARTEAGGVGQLEMHGTGTSLGDPIEVGAATAVLRGDGCATSVDVLTLEAAKSRLGHCELGAGIIGIVSAISRVGGAAVSALRHLRMINPHVEAVVGAAKLRAPGAHRTVSSVLLPQQTTSGAAGESRQSAHGLSYGVSGSAFQGTNAHALVGSAPGARPLVVSDGMACRVWERRRH
jgi:acyl transferase domain-containing protein